MKNRSVKAAVISASFALSAPLLTGCQDIIYAKIMNEVQLDDAEVNGTVNSIVRVGDSSTGNVYYQNGLISYKSASSASHVSWTNGMQNLSALSYSYYDNTWSGVYVKKLAANDTYMYALAVTYKQDTSEGENVPDQQILYCSTGPGTDWTQVQSWTYSSSTAVTLFCTNTPKVAHRVAYIRVGTNLYQLTGASFPDTVTAADSSACSAYYFGGSPYPTSYWATGTNETASADATYWYYATSDMLYYAMNGAWGTIAVGIFGDLAALGGMHTRMGMIGVQLLGVVSVFAWVAITAGVLFFILKKTIGLRVPAKEEMRGLDIGEHGSEAYSGFQFFSNM